MEKLGQCEEQVLQLQERVTELERENERLQAENIQLRKENETLRASEARYRKCFENSPISMVFIASDGRPIQANQAFERLYGMPLEQLKERNFNVFHDPQLVENGSLSYINQAFAGETVIEPPTYYDGAKTVPGGRFSWNQALYFPIRDEAGVVQEIVEACLDLTELYDAQQALLQEQEKVAQERAVELALANDALRRSVGHLTTADSLNSFLVAVLQEAIQASGAVSAAVFVYEPSENTLLNTTLVLHGSVVDIATDPRTEIWRSSVPADLTNVWQAMIQERRIFWFDNDNPEPEYWLMSIPWHDQFGHKNIATIPLFIGEQALGFLGLCFTTHQQPSESKLEQWWTLAQHAALALRMSQLAESAKQAAIATEQEKPATFRAAELTELNAALSVSESRLRTLFEQLPVSLQIFSDDGVCLEVNRAWSTLR